MVLPTLYDSYPFISPEKYKGKLDGKVAVVTGSSSGIGVGIAKALAAAGAKVACVARREADLKKVVDDIIGSGNKAAAFTADIAERGAAKKLISRIETHFEQSIDVLVNNAGIARIGAVEYEDEELDKWWRVYEVNVRAPVALIRAVLPSMLERKSGRIITISSGVAKMSFPAMSAYASSKAAIYKFHDSLQPELAGTGVVSFALNPGMVESGLGSGPDGFNAASSEHPTVKKFMEHIKTSGGPKRQALALPSDTVTALAADDRFDILSGRSLDAVQDLEPVVAEAEKEGKGRLGSERIYLIDIPSL